MLRSVFALAGCTLAVSSQATGLVPLELTVNGGFESGDATGFTSFPSAGSTFVVSPAFASTGGFGAEVFNNSPASAAVIQQLGIGQGVVVTGEEVSISFDARGETAAGGVVFAEFFSELAAGGTSRAEILGSGPLALTDAFQTFTFTTLTGPDVSGGVTLQFAVITGGDLGSTARFEVDNASVTVQRVPEPATALLLGLGGLAVLGRRRRRRRA